jgi:serine/threonine-protein kinase RsbW
MPDLSTAVSVDVPATPEFIQVLRNVAAGVAARLDMPIDQIEDIRLAVAEAGSLLLQETQATSLRMTIGRDGDTLDVTLMSDGRVDPWPTDRVTTSWPWLVVKGLTDEVRADRAEGSGPSISFTKGRERVPR